MKLIESSLKYEMYSADQPEFIISFTVSSFQEDYDAMQSIAEALTDNEGQYNYDGIFALFTFRYPDIEDWHEAAEELINKQTQLLDLIYGTRREEESISI